MTPPSHLVARRVLAVFASALLVALGTALPSRAMSAAPSSAPRIVAVRVGLAGAYKLGCWTPLEVTLRGGREPVAGIVEVVVPDSDGVPATVATPAEAPIALAAEATVTAHLFIRVGQDGAPLVVRFVDPSGGAIAMQTFIPAANADEADSQNRSFPAGLPATNNLLVTFGAREDLASVLARDEQADNPADALRTVRLASADDLPRAWFGYEGVDAVILGSSQPELYDDFSNDDPRLEALARWVELGGQLVIFCGENAENLLAAGRPLATLLPGRFEKDLAQLPDLGALEAFSGAAVAITPTDVRRVRIPQLVEVSGRVLAQGAAQVPLAVRARRGLGEVTFIAVDPEAAPFDRWSERAGLIRQALGRSAAASTTAAGRGYAGPVTPDLANQLRSALDQQFAGVVTAHFALVAALAIGYIALVGPGDYLFVRRVLRRMHLTWITFPLILVGVSAAAYAMAYRMKGAELRVNQVEIVDVDLAAGAARGTVWTHLFNPRIQRYTLTLAPRFADQPLASRGTQSTSAQRLPTAASALGPPLVAWLGVPGYGLGAMQGQRGTSSHFEPGYRFGAEFASLVGLPVEQWSTKTLTARWTGPVAAPLETQLHAVGDELLEGSVTNRTGVALDDCVLIRGGWAYQLGALPDGATAAVRDDDAPRTLRNTLTSRTAGDDARVRTTDDGSVLFDSLSIDVARIVKLMMFYEAVGGAAYARTPHRYQGFVDLSRLLKGDQAILLARAPAGAGSHWQSADAEASAPAVLASERDRRWVFYRFVIPLAPDRRSDVGAQPVIGPAPQPARDP